MKNAILLAAVTLAAATTASAQTNSTMTKPAAPVTKPKAAQSATPPMKTGKTATVTTKSGKKITYDCSKKGNMTKKACKG